MDEGEIHFHSVLDFCFMGEEKEEETEWGTLATHAILVTFRDLSAPFFMSVRFVHHLCHPPLPI